METTLQQLTVRGRDVEVGDSVRIIGTWRGLIATEDYSETYRRILGDPEPGSDAYADAGARVGTFSDGTRMTLEGLVTYTVRRAVAPSGLTHTTTQEEHR